MPELSLFPNRFMRRIAMLAASWIALASPTALQPLHAGAPSNDNCGAAQEITLGETAFSTLDATSAGPAVCVAFGRDVWFKFRSTFTGPLRISTCGDADFDTVIAVYDGCSCGSLVPLGCADQTTGCGSGTTRITVPVKAGRCYLIRVGGYMADAGLGTLTLRVDDPENAGGAHRICTGAEPGDRFGTVVGGGRINSDIYADIFVSGHLNDMNGPNTGRAYAYKGSAQASLAGLYTRTGAAAQDQFGFSIATCDVNNDGRLDLIVGAPLNDFKGANAGRVWAFSGYNGALLWARNGEAAGQRFGHCVACAGDVNNDGYDDVIVGAPYASPNGYRSGRVYIIKGQNGAFQKKLKGPSANSYFGWAVAGIGDLNDDGKDDYAVGSPKHSGAGNAAGRVTIFSGNGTALKHLNGDAPGDQFGSALAGMTLNVGGSKLTYLMVGAPFNDAAGANAGRVRVFWRNHTNPNANGCNAIICPRHTINGGNAGDRFGRSVALANVVGNALPDYIIGATHADLNGSNSGAAYVFANGSSPTLVARFHGEAPGDQFGTSVAVPGDVNNDGMADLLAGAPYNDAGGADAGRAYLFLVGAGEGARLAAAPDFPGSDMASADLNADGQITADDLVAMLAMWGPCPDPLSNPDALPCAADLDRNGQVDADDLLELLNNWE